MSVVTMLPDCKHELKVNSMNTPTSSSKSMNSSHFTMSSSKFSALNRRKNIQRNRDRNPTLIPAVSEVKQRVISARLLRFKQLQNQIAEAHHRISELTAENRLLKSLHKRQDSALTKYQSSSAELPQLLHSHAEEVRIWQTRCRNLQRQHKDVLGKMKQKETQILTLSDQNKHLLQLNKDKHLEEREKLTDRVRDLEQRLLDKDNDLKLLARRLQLETKAFKSNIYMEQQKYRDLVHKIELSDFMMQRTKADGDKKSSKDVRQNGRLKSPTRAFSSKSATQLNNGEDKEQTTLILPPCEGQEVKKKTDESIKINSPLPNLNGNVKTVPEKDEIDMTKSLIDKSERFLRSERYTQDNDDLVVSVRNGMNRARLLNKPNITNDKLIPLHPKQDTKKSSDDSELSDNDFQLINNEDNGTKMVMMSLFKTHNAKDLLEHKKHVNELETKLKQRHILTSSSSSSSLSEDPQTIVNGRGDGDLAYIQREMTMSTLRRESFLDEYCETLADDKTEISKQSTITKIKKLEFIKQPPDNSPSILSSKSTNYVHYHNKTNGNAVSNGTRKQTIDSKKKSSLLAAIKNIDNDSTER
ncbi:CLUMA_CG019526, isoform A [Clunio marinus]|uniref:CLUMA_CG019526, isoform A n=1 Tax=Clunio marinus TaxID=568069 RepID=A0A1J1J3K5_9DIPT|nr:CLUMA_CG019526, isoform A [Clunio marinus]